MDLYTQFKNTQKLRVSDGQTLSLLTNIDPDRPSLILVWPQLGDFDSLEYAWWLQKEQDQIRQHDLQIRAIGIGDRTSGQAFCDFTGFPAEHLFVDPEASLHRQLNLYPGIQAKLPILNDTQQAWVNLLLMCAGIGSPGTLSEVFRGYTGDRSAPQLIADDETVQATPLPKIQGEFFKRAGGKGFQRPFELATLRLRNMTEVLKNWSTYVPDSRFMTQRGGTFLFSPEGQLLYEYRDKGILGFSATMNQPLDFLSQLTARAPVK